MKRAALTVIAAAALSLTILSTAQANQTFNNAVTGE